MRPICLWMVCLLGLISCSGEVESDGGGEVASGAQQTEIDGSDQSSSDVPSSVSQRAAAKSKQLMPATGKSDAIQLREQTELTADQLATLKAADMSDGVEDGVVSDCSRCSMMMPGDEVHTSHIADYKLQFCAAGCKAGFEADLDKGIAEIQSALEEN